MNAGNEPATSVSYRREWNRRGAVNDTAAVLSNGESIATLGANSNATKRAHFNALVVAGVSQIGGAELPP